MSSSRALGRRFAVMLAGAVLVGCVATTSPSALQSVPSPSTASSAPSASASSIAPLPTPTSTATASIDPGSEPQPTPTAEATSQPDPTPSPIRPIAGCGTGEAGFAAHRSEIPKTLAFGHATIEFTPAGTGMRDGSYDVDDAIPGGVGLTADEIAVVVGPGDHIILRATGLTLLDTSAAASPWSQVTFDGGLASLGGAKAVLPWRVRADGSLSISAPDAVGDWAVEFFPHWQGDCLKGDGTAYARIKVR